MHASATAATAAVLIVTCCWADCGVLLERFGRRPTVFSVAADERGVPAALVAVVRLVQRADDARQHLWCCDVGGQDASNAEFVRW